MVGEKKKGDARAAKHAARDAWGERGAGEQGQTRYDGRLGAGEGCEGMRDEGGAQRGRERATGPDRGLCRPLAPWLFVRHAYYESRPLGPDVVPLCTSAPVRHLP